MRVAALTRALLFLLIASTTIAALLGIVAVIAGDWSWFEIRILLTAATISATSLGGLACGAALPRARLWAVPAIGIGLAAVAAVFIIVGMWLEPRSEEYWKVTFSVIVFAVAAAHVSLLSIARLTPGTLWVQWVAYAVTLALATVIVAVVWGENLDDWTGRVIAVLAILDAAFTVLVPVVHFLSRKAVADAELAMDDAAIDAEITRLRARIAELEATRQAARAG